MNSAKLDQTKSMLAGVLDLMAELMVEALDKGTLADPDLAHAEEEARESLRRLSKVGRL